MLSQRPFDTPKICWTTDAANGSLLKTRCKLSINSIFVPTASVRLYIMSSMGLVSSAAVIRVVTQRFSLRDDPNNCCEGDYYVTRMGTVTLLAQLGWAQ